MSPKVYKWLFSSICCIPAISLIVEIWLYMGANPVETMLHTTGEWALNLLLITLGITPLRKLTHWRLNWFAIRRVTGIAVFVYGFLHFSVYAVFEYALDWADMLVDILAMQFLLVGAITLTLLLPLTITSNNLSQRRLKKRWHLLHRLVYLIAVLGIVHYLLLIKADYSGVIPYVIIFALLMLLRVNSVSQLFRLLVVKITN